MLAMGSLEAKQHTPQFSSPPYRTCTLSTSDHNVRALLLLLALLFQPQGTDMLAVQTANPSVATDLTYLPRTAAMNYIHYAVERHALKVCDLLINLSIASVCSAILSRLQ